ncbi:MAG: ABC transporter substrate-binding protein [Acidisphaera sp.]|nr:ABC transporter substrate-binding protein [Acidisphaera sp.]
MRIQRRNALFAAAALAASPLLSRPAAAQGKPDDQGKLEDAVIVRDTGGEFGKALKQCFYDPFTRASGVKVIPVATSYGDMIAKTVAMSKAGHVEWDIISPQFYELGLLAPYLVDLGDCSALPNVASQGLPGICGRHGVQYLMGGVVLSWDPRAFPERAPQSWADFWNVAAFPGRRALPSYGNPWNNTLLFALMADGVPADKLFPLDLDRAFRKLDEIRPHIDLWWKTGAQSEQMFRSGNIQLSPMWSGTAYAVKRTGVSLDWTFHQAAADRGSWAILKDSPHPNAARAFINFYMTNPENHVAFARAMGYATTNRASLALLDAAERHELVSSPEMLAELAGIDGEWVEAHRAATLDRWNSWISG